MQRLLIAALPEAQSLQDQMLKQARQVTSLQDRLVEEMKQYKPHLVPREGMMYDAQRKPPGCERVLSSTPIGNETVYKFDSCQFTKRVTAHSLR